MADKRISQLIERVDIANNDVLPIVASGATTTNKVTVSTLQDWMQDNLDVGVTSVGITIGSTGTDVNVTGSPVTSSGNITINIPTASATNRGLLSSANWTTFNNKVSSVGLSMPSAFSVANSPITGSGTIAVTGAGTVSQYIRGDGSLADFPSGGGGGGASVNYYLNGSVSQGTIGGIAYQEMNKVPVLGAGTDFVAIADGYLASFITDAGDPGLLEIPGGNWNFETYFSASSGGGTPTFYVELYKVNSGGTATLIASNSGTPELIAFGTTITPYFSTLAVPTTALAITDRLALRYYVARSGRTITLHTENSHLCQIITTFTTGLTALNGLTAQVQNFATGTSGTDFAISSSVSTHTFNLPDASASARGVVTTGTQTFAGYKIFTGTISANNDIQLAAAGTASTTFIKNISGAGLTSIGSNGFGFNNSDNIYFSGSNKGGGIIAFSNTGNQTYTLQNASGTLAFTSQIPANPVGGTGTANIIPKFTGGSTLGDSSLQNVSNSISNLNPPSGQFAWQLNGNATTGQSFGALVVAGTNASDIAFAVRNTGGVTTLFEVQGDGNVGIGTNTPTDFGSTYKVLSIDGAGGGGVLDLMNTGVRTLTLAVDGGEASISSRVSGNPLIFKTNNAGTVATRLTLASTGAATFSSSVTSVGLISSSTVRPSSNYAADLGTSSVRWADIFGASLNVQTTSTAANVISIINASQRLDLGLNDAAGGSFIFASVNQALRFGTNDTERMRITSDGTIRLTRSSGTVDFTVFQTGGGDNFCDVSANAFRTNTHLPINDNTSPLGSSGSRWSAVWAVNGTIQTSDEREKKEIIDSDLGLDFVTKLRPVSFKWKVGQNMVTSEVLKDEEGNPILDEESKEKTESVITPREGIRTHYGLIAQEVEELLDGKDFGGFIHDEETDIKGLRYDQFVPLLIKAIQELKTEIDSLKNQIK